MNPRYFAEALSLSRFGLLTGVVLGSTVLLGACSDSGGTTAHGTGGGGSAANHGGGGGGMMTDAGGMTGGGGGTTESDGGVTSDAGQGPTPESLCAAFADDECGKLAQCAVRVYYNYVTPEDCLSSTKLDCMRGFANPKWTPAAQTACNAARKAGGCEVLFTTPDACVHPAGDKAVGSPCFRSDECVMGASCVQQTGRTSACGVCKMDAQLNEACGSGVQCVAGLRCDATCYTPSKSGQACNVGALCAFPLVCGAAGDLCHMPKPIGATCGPTIDDCDQYNGIHCNAATHKCENVLVAMKVGDHCGFDSTTGNSTVCANGLRCSVDDIKIGLCNNAAKEGQTCQVDSKGNDPCGGGLYCAGTCMTGDKVMCN